MPIKMVTNKLGDVKNRIKELTKDKVFVGVPEGGGRSDGKMTNAQIARVHEFGSPAQNIPARPFLTAGVTTAKPEIVTQMRQASLDILSGKSGDSAFNKAGLIGQAAVKKYVVAGGFAPLSPKTIQARNRARSNGNGGTKPLIDTGQLLNSITYVIRSK